MSVSPASPSPAAAAARTSAAAQAARGAQAGLVLMIYAVFAVVQHLEVMLGMIDAAASWALTAWNLTGGIGFYLVIRSGLNLRLKRHRSLAMPQSVWAMVGVTWSYAITGPARGAVILIMLLLIFFTMFELTPAKARVVAGGAFAMLASTMVWKATTDPVRYDPRVEGMHLLFTGIVLAAALVHALRFGRLRARLERQRAELTAALEHIGTLATRDELTGLVNRRAALSRMRDELAVRGRPVPMMSVALMDIDHFKRINDSHGHAAGDVALRRFADCGQALVRTGDLLARWGGEEFLLAMPATSTAQALSAMSRLRLALQQVRFDDIAPGLTLTFSAGVAECGGEADLDAAIGRADAAMYRAKHAGRDQALAEEPAGG